MSEWRKLRDELLADPEVSEEYEQLKEAHMSESAATGERISLVEIALNAVGFDVLNPMRSDHNYQPENIEAAIEELRRTIRQSSFALSVALLEIAKAINAVNGVETEE